jgi:hypothetical protein
MSTGTNTHNLNDAVCSLNQSLHESLPPSLIRLRYIDNKFCFGTIAVPTRTLEICTVSVSKIYYGQQFSEIIIAWLV